MSTKQTQPQTIVVIGLDKEGKPRGAAYPADMAETAAKAAADWKLMLGKAENEEALELAKDLPHGSLFPSHKMQPPNIKRENYDLIIKTIKCDAPSAANYKNPWDMIEVGGTVLCEEDPGQGYYVCRVVGMSQDRKILTCAWVGYPKLPHFQVKRSLVGLIGVVK